MATNGALLGGVGQVLDADEVRGFIADQLAAADLAGSRVLVVVPDSTRTCPLPLLVAAVHDALAGRVAALDVMIALGTHPPMSDQALAEWVGYSPDAVETADQTSDMTISNHAWWDPAALTTLGVIGADEVAELSGGRLRQDIPVEVNRAVLDHDVILVVGPVFPHEVIGFSGGNKYLFPGIAGSAIINASHWLGALITAAEIIGTPGITPVRAVVDRAAAMIPARLLAFCLVVESGTDRLAAVSFGTTADAWAAAVDISARTHIKYLDHPVRRVLSMVAPRYDELWTAAKGCYKVEPVVADGGELVLYAPKLERISETHGPHIRQVGYHCLAYLQAHARELAGIPAGVLAHSAHVRGAGRWDPERGEQCRYQVTLATGIDEATTRAVGLEYLDPASIDVASWEADPETLVVHEAGEVLYRLRAS